MCSQMSTDTIDILRQKWRRAGYLFAEQSWHGEVCPAELIAGTLDHVRTDPDLFEAATTWLSRFGYLLPWRYLLGQLKRRGCSPLQYAILGHMLESSDAFSGDNRFTRACKKLQTLCAEHRDAVPLSRESESMTEYVSVLRDFADPISLRWNVLVGDVKPRYDALEPNRSVFERNPGWLDVEFMGKGKEIDKSILSFLSDEPAGISKTKLAGLCGVTRAAIHAPVERLIKLGKVLQTGKTRSSKLKLVAAAAGAS